MGRFATREDEVDELFQLGVFVDLYRVLRQGLRAGVESYSIKRLEPLIGFHRDVDLRDATEHLIAFEATLDEGTAETNNQSREIVAGYNEDGCRATLALRDWLEKRRVDLANQLGERLPRPVAHEDPRADQDPDVGRIKLALVADVPGLPTQRTAEEQAKALMADLLEWHKREAKAAWWRYFHLRNLSNEELISEPDAIGGLDGGGIVGEVRRSVLRRFSFPPQEHGFIEGNKVLIQ